MSQTWYTPYYLAGTEWDFWTFVHKYATEGNLFLKLETLWFLPVIFLIYVINYPI